MADEVLLPVQQEAGKNPSVNLTVVNDYNFNDLHGERTRAGGGETVCDSQLP